jgi:hypothetical protein
MAIVQTITESAFIDAFMQSSRKDQFSYEALSCIFEYLEEYSDSTGEPVELDIIAICCDWAEMTAEEVISSYPDEFGPQDLSDMSEEDTLQWVHDFLADNTILAGMTPSNTFVFIQF